MEQKGSKLTKACETEERTIRKELRRGSENLSRRPVQRYTRDDGRVLLTWCLSGCMLGLGVLTHPTRALSRFCAKSDPRSFVASFQSRRNGHAGSATRGALFRVQSKVSSDFAKV